MRSVEMIDMIKVTTRMNNIVVFSFAKPPSTAGSLLLVSILSAVLPIDAINALLLALGILSVPYLARIRMLGGIEDVDGKLEEKRSLQHGRQRLV